MDRRFVPQLAVNSGIGPLRLLQGCRRARAYNGIWNPLQGNVSGIAVHWNRSDTVSVR